MLRLRAELGHESLGAAGTVALLVEHSCLLIPALGCQNHRCPWRAGGGTGVFSECRHGELGHRCGWGRELSGVRRHGDRWSRRCRQLHRSLGAATLPHGHVDSSTGTKGPLCVTVMLPRASRGCLLCCFEDSSAPAQPVGFYPPLPQSCGTCQTWTASRAARTVPAPIPAALCSLPGTAGAAGEGHTVTTAVQASLTPELPLPQGTAPTARPAAQPRLRLRVLGLWSTRRRHLSSSPLRSSAAPAVLAGAR